MKKMSLWLLIVAFIVTLASCGGEEPPQIGTSESYLELYPNIDNYYQIFIRSFADSNDDGIGDIKGIENNLDYLESLGITAIWLTPFHPSGSYHGYNVTDYYDVNPDFGTLEDLESLIDAAASKNIDIMMDLVINHSSDQHPWYLEALRDSSSPYRDYYYFNGNSSAYQSFVGGMVDFDPTSEAFRAEVKRMLDFYVEMGIKKFRLDAAAHFYDKPGLTGSDLNAGLYILELNAYLKQTYGEDTLITSEVFDYSDVRYDAYLIGSDSLFNFFGSLHIQNKLGLQTSRSYYVSILDRYYKDRLSANPEMIDSIFLTNHDLDRLRHRVTNADARKHMVEALLTLPGNPYVYYGEELDMFGQRQEGVEVSGYGTAYDEFRRTAFLWGDERQTSWFPDAYNNDTQTINEAQADTTSIYHVYHTMLSLRMSYPALMFGDFEPYESNDYNIQGFYRTFYDGALTQRILVIHNIDNEAATFQSIPGATVLYGSYDMPAYSTLIVLMES